MTLVFSKDWKSFGMSLNDGSKYVRRSWTGIQNTLPSPPQQNKCPVWQSIVTKLGHTKKVIGFEKSTPALQSLFSCFTQLFDLGEIMFSQCLFPFIWHYEKFGSRLSIRNMFQYKVFFIYALLFHSIFKATCRKLGWYNHHFDHTVMNNETSHWII